MFVVVLYEHLATKRGKPSYRQAANTFCATVSHNSVSALRTFVKSSIFVTFAICATLYIAYVAETLDTQYRARITGVLIVYTTH